MFQAHIGGIEKEVELCEKIFRWESNLDIFVEGGLEGIYIKVLNNKVKNIKNAVVWNKEMHGKIIYRHFNGRGKRIYLKRDRSLIWLIWGGTK